jgi:hypothetical protein
MKKFVVIGGMYRSGTTLTETIIGSHSKISIPPGDFPFIQGYTEGKSIIKIFEPLIKKKLWKRWQVSDFSDFYSLSHKEAFIKILTRSPLNMLVSRLI